MARVEPGEKRLWWVREETGQGWRPMRSKGGTPDPLPSLTEQPEILAPQNRAVNHRFGRLMRGQGSGQVRQCELRVELNFRKWHSTVSVIR